MLKLLTTDIWNQVAEKANGCEMRVAVAFVTDLGRLKMKRGDVLICDASDQNITAGVVDRDLLQKLSQRGVCVFHRQNLHAKCALFGKKPRYALVGSSNLSQNSSENLEEIALVTDDPAVGAKVDAQMGRWMDEGVKVDNAFLDRIMLLPSVKRLLKGNGKRVALDKKYEFGNRIWVVGPTECDFTEEEQRECDKTKAVAESRRSKYNVARCSPIEQLKWSGRESFVKSVQSGDFIVEILKGRVSVKIILAFSRVGQDVYCNLLPVLGMRSRSFKDFNMALGISNRKLVYRNGCARLLLKKHVPMLKKLWSHVDWGDW